MVETAFSQVGFVVIGRNEGKRLEQSLLSVLRLSSRVVYVDSASTDDSASAARCLGAFVVELPADGQLCAARGRNAGYSELMARFPDCGAVQFLDGDCILEPHFVSAALAFLNSHPEAAVVCGQRFERRPGASIYNAICDREWNTQIGRAEACGGDALMRTAAFDQVGGFRSSLRAGEEPELTARMRAAGWEIWRINARMTEHDAKIYTFGQWWRRTVRTGFGYAQVWEATKALPERLYGRNLRSGITWTIALPLLCIVAAIALRQPLVMVLLIAAYGLQVFRIAQRAGIRGESGFVMAALILIAKFPEMMGAARYFLTRDKAPPEYKIGG